MRNNSIQVYKGGWDELQNAHFTSNQAMIPNLPRGAFMKPDGTQIFSASATTSLVEVYNLVVPYDIDTISTIVDSFDPGFSIFAIFFKFDGDKMYLASIDDIFEYILPTPWIVSSIVDSPVSIPLPVSDISDMFISTKGDFLFLCKASSAIVFSLPLPTLWDITSNVSNTSFPTGSVDPNYIFFKPEGDKMFLGDANDDKITEYDLSSVWDITTSVPNGNFLDTSSMGVIFNGFMRSNGLELFLIDLLGNPSMKLHLDEAWNISTASHFTNEFDTLMPVNFSVQWKPDGTKFFTLDEDFVREWIPTTPWNLTDAVASNSFNIQVIDGNMQGMWWKPDGTRCYVIGVSTRRIHQLNLSLSWNVITMTNPGISEFIGSTDNSPSGITFRRDGRKLWFCGQSSNTIYERNMATPWDIASSTVGVFQILPGIGALSHGIFKPDGKMLFAADRDANDLTRYSLSIPWDVTTITEEDSRNIADMEMTIRSLFIRENDGKKLFISGNEPTLFSYDMTEEFNNSIITQFGDELITKAGELIVTA